MKNQNGKYGFLIPVAGDCPRIDDMRIASFIASSSNYSPAFALCLRTYTQLPGPTSGSMQRSSPKILFS